MSLRCKFGKHRWVIVASDTTGRVIRCCQDCPAVEVITPNDGSDSNNDSRDRARTEESK